MKKIFLGMLVFVSTTVARAQDEVVVDPNAELRTLNASFHSIKVSGGIDLYLSQSDKEAIAVSASEDKFIKAMKTTVENGVLKIYMDEGFLHISTKNRNLKVYVSFKDLDKLEASGASDVHVSGTIAVNILHLNLSGASDFKGNVKVNDLEIDLSGASDVKIGGTATTVDIASSGASDIKGYDLSAETCTAKASGASDIQITVNKELNAHASGACKISFKGAGSIKEMHSSGSSKIERKS